jgi:L-lactate dehydrogenase
MRLPEFSKAQGLPFDWRAMDEISLQTRDAAYRIIERKGATYFAVAAGLMRITPAILRNQSTALSVSSLIHDYYGIGDVFFSLPTVIDRGGVEHLAPGTEPGGNREIAALGGHVESGHRKTGP